MVLLGISGGARWYSGVFQAVRDGTEGVRDNITIG
ncbi:unnamed protein product [Anisakis simplex]|uniref:Phage tail protein n=1 Tax=Anisakis simplex TaxID=6269 RepID=A0A0M3JPN5_ANISI|nr:unnamed protein product [Anisakis simplex]